MTKLARLFVAGLVLLTPALAVAQRSAVEQKVWSLEEDYWKYVQANDLEDYRGLWHEAFLGWPNSSPEPARKAHITDWITAHTSKGDTLKSYNLEKRIVEVTGDIATTTYRVRVTWLRKIGAEESEKVRIIHTWRRNPVGDWQIISGMSAPTDANGH